MEVGIVTEILNAFIGAFSGGFDRLRPAVGGLLRILVTLDVLFFAVMLIFGIEAIQNGLRKLLVLSLWTYVIQDFDGHATRVVNSLIQAGFTAAGRGGADPHELLDPSRILAGSFEATQPLANNLLNAGVLDIADYMMFGISYLFIMLAFGALALNAFLVVIEYYLAMAVAGSLIPFGVLQPTRWLAMKPISFLISSGIKLMVISFIMAISGSVLGRITFATDEPSLKEIMTMMFASGTLAMVAWIAPQRLAAGFMAGSASLGGSDAVGFGASVASGAMTSTRAVAPSRGGGVASAAKWLGGAAVVGGAAAYGALRSSISRGASSTPGGSSHAGAARPPSPLTASAMAAAPRPAKPPELVAPSSNPPASGKLES